MENRMIWRHNETQNREREREGERDIVRERERERERAIQFKRLEKEQPNPSNYPFHTAYQNSYLKNPLILPDSSTHKDHIGSNKANRDWHTVQFNTTWPCY